MPHHHTRETIRRPGRGLRMDNPAALPVFDASQLFAAQADAPRALRDHASLSDTVERMAGALCRLSCGNLEGVTEEDLRREQFSPAQIAACFDEAADIARRAMTRRIRSGRED